MYVLTITLVVSPLRGLLAMPMSHASNSLSPCEQMHHAVHGTDARSAMQAATMEQPCPGCKKRCGDGHCGVQCAGCAHALTAAGLHPAPVAAASRQLLAETVPERFYSRTARPPFRPPISRS
jgi:hypothetical protein